MRLNGVSRMHSTNLRPSLSMTSADRAIKSSLMPFAIAASVPIEHGITNVLVGQDLNLVRSVAQDPARQQLQVPGRKPQLLGKKALPGFRDHQMHSRNASVVLEKCQRLLRKKRATRSGHTYADDLSLWRHCVWIHSVSQPLPVKSRTCNAKRESHDILTLW